jgi:hypothetical protein
MSEEYGPSRGAFKRLRGSRRARAVGGLALAAGLEHRAADESARRDVSP